MKRLIIIVLCLSFVVSGAFIANAQKTTIEVWYHEYGEEGTHEAVLRYAKAYENAHPEVSVKVSWIPGDYNTKLNTALVSKSGTPDIFELGQSPSLSMVEAGHVAPLDNLFTPEIKDDFVETAIKQNTIRGHIYGVKQLIDAGVLYYHKSILKDAGLDVPSTFGELFDAAKKLTRGTQKGLFLGNDGGGAWGELLPHANGQGPFISADGTKIMFNTRETVEALEGLRRLRNSGTLLTGAPMDWWDPSAFLYKMCAITWGGLWEFPEIKREIEDEFGVLPCLPFTEGKNPSTFFGGWNAHVNGYSKNIKVAKDYIRWLWIADTGRDYALDFNVGYGFHIPARKSFVEVTAKLTEDPRAAKIVDWTFQYGWVNSHLWNDIMGLAYGDMISQVLNSDKPIAPLVEEAAKRCQAELERVIK